MHVFQGEETSMSNAQPGHDFAESQVFQTLKRCLWLLDSGDLANARLAVKESDLCPRPFGAAIVLEARRLYPAPDDGGKADFSIEQQLVAVLSEPSVVVERLAAEINGQHLTAEAFEVLRRLLETARRASPPDAAAEWPLIVDGRVRLDRLASLLDRAEREPRAEEALRSGLFDRHGRVRRETMELFTSAPFLRPIIQATVDNARLREAGMRRIGRRVLAACLLLASAGGVGIVGIIAGDQQATLVRQAADMRTAVGKLERASEDTRITVGKLEAANADARIAIAKVDQRAAVSKLERASADIGSAIGNLEAALKIDERLDRELHAMGSEVQKLSSLLKKEHDDQTRQSTGLDILTKRLQSLQEQLVSALNAARELAKAPRLVASGTLNATPQSYLEDHEAIFSVNIGRPLPENAIIITSNARCYRHPDERAGDPKVNVGPLFWTWHRTDPNKPNEFEIIVRDFSNAHSTDVQITVDWAVLDSAGTSLTRAD
jgi:hypothetical protein